MTDSFVARLAHGLSLLFHPLILIGITAIALNIQAHHNIPLGLRDTLIFVLCLMPGLIYLALQKRKKQPVNYGYRVLPLLLVGLVATFGIYWFLKTPLQILQGVFIALIIGIGATIIERRWDMSNHAWVPMSCAAMWFPFSTYIAFGCVVIGLVAGLARLPIRQHSLVQVIGGWIYGFGVTFTLVNLILRF